MYGIKLSLKKLFRNWIESLCGSPVRRKGRAAASTTRKAAHAAPQAPTEYVYMPVSTYRNPDLFTMEVPPLQFPETLEQAVKYMKSMRHYPAELKFFVLRMKRTDLKSMVDNFDATHVYPIYGVNGELVPGENLGARNIQLRDN